MTMTKYQAAQLRKAARTKGMRHATFGVFSHLITITQHGRWPATRRALAAVCNTSPTSFDRVTADLISHRWVTTVRGGGKGNPTRYTVQEGEPWPRKVPKTNAEKCRDYRARLREEGRGVTEIRGTTDTESGAQTTPKNVAQSGLRNTPFWGVADPEIRSLTSENRSASTNRG